MSRVMMLVSAQGAVMGETRVDEAAPGESTTAEARLREEALVSGFCDEDVRTARLVMVGDLPNQP